MIWFALASLTPAAFLALGCLFGGPWAGLGILTITVFTFFIDRFVARLMGETPEGDGLVLSYLQGAVHFALWGLGIWAVGGGGAHLDFVDRALLLLGLGLYFGQVSNSNAHELIHNAGRLPRRLGMAIYGSLLFAHHVSAHRLVHHVHAATPLDPNTARLGEGFWRYLIRAWVDGFIAGKRAEDRLRRGRFSVWSHPYLTYIALALLAFVAAFALAGGGGIAALLGIAAYAQVQLFLSDYVQHYGLLRATDDAGKTEPMGKQHSWNAPHWYSAAMMLNAPRHSDHHQNPERAFPTLRLDPAQMPMLPHSLPLMAVIALMPPLWRRVMDRRVARWRAAGTNSPTLPAGAGPAPPPVTEQTA